MGTKGVDSRTPPVADSGASSRGVPMGLWGKLFDKQARAEAALAQALQLHGVSLEAVPREVLAAVAAHCVHIAYGPAAKLDTMGPQGLCAGSARLQSHVNYVARLIGATAAGEMTIETLRARCPSLYEAVARGVVAGAFGTSPTTDAR